MKTRHTILFTQLEAYRNELLAVLEGVTEEMAEIIPPGFRNNIRWNMGHVFLDQFLWIAALTKDMGDVSPAYQNWFGFGTSPSDFTEETPSFEELKQLLETQPKIIKETYGNRLEEEFLPLKWACIRSEQVLIRTIFHEGMHFQAILNIKRVFNHYHSFSQKFFCC